jgi:hypothetical protein
MFQFQFGRERMPSIYTNYIAGVSLRRFLSLSLKIPSAPLRASIFSQFPNLFLAGAARRLMESAGGAKEFLIHGRNDFFLLFKIKG